MKHVHMKPVECQAYVYEHGQLLGLVWTHPETRPADAQDRMTPVLIQEVSYPDGQTPVPVRRADQPRPE